MRRWPLIAFLFAAPLGGAEAAELLRLPPPEAVAPEAADLHAELQHIIAGRDAAALAALADPAVKLSFGGDHGRETLMGWAAEDWFWPEWGRITSHPPAIEGEGEGGYLAYPWYFAEWPDDLDPFDHMVGGDGAALVERPLEGAAALADLSFAILPGDVEDAAPDGWRRICVTDDGPCGFVEEARLASPIGWRAVFLKVDGRWRMTAFVAGD